MSLDETCSKCGKTISIRAIAHISDDQIVCSNCRRSMDKIASREEFNRNRDAGPASEAQVSFLKNLGVANAHEFTFSQAHRTIDSFQGIRQYAFEVAKQVWKKFVPGLDVKFIALAVLCREADPGRIPALMASRYERARSRQVSHEAKYGSRKNYDPPSFDSFFDPLPEDEVFHWVQNALSKQIKG